MREFDSDELFLWLVVFFAVVGLIASACGLGWLVWRVMIFLVRTFG